GGRLALRGERRGGEDDEGQWREYSATADDGAMHVGLPSDDARTRGLHDTGKAASGPFALRSQLVAVLPLQRWNAKAGVASGGQNVVHSGTRRGRSDAVQRPGDPVDLPRVPQLVL